MELVAKENFHHSLIKKKENWNNRQSCSFKNANSPLNSLSLPNTNGFAQDTTSNNPVIGDSIDMEILEDVLQVTLEIGDKKMENVAISSQCLLQDLAEEFADNETIRVAYFLNERIKKGGEKCDALDAQVLVKLRPKWKWVPLEDLVEDLTITVEEMFTDMPEFFQLAFSLAPRPGRVEASEQEMSITVDPTPCESNHDLLINLVTDLKTLFTKYPVGEMLNDSTEQPVIVSNTDMQAFQDLKKLLHGVNSLLFEQFPDPSILRHSFSRQQNKQTQIPEEEHSIHSDPQPWPMADHLRGTDSTPVEPHSHPNTRDNPISELRPFNSPVLETFPSQRNPEKRHYCPPFQSPSSSQAQVDSRQFNSTLPSNSFSQTFSVVLPSHPPLQTVGPPQPSTQCYNQQLANDLPTQCYVDSKICEEPSVKSPDDESAAPLSRVRIQFDRVTETPLLRQWFEVNPVPSKNMICNYVDELNSRDIRKGKDPVTYRAVYIWFKNTRARSTKKKSFIKADSEQT